MGLKRKNIKESNLKDICLAIIAELQYSEYNFRIASKSPDVNFVWHLDSYDKSDKDTENVLIEYLQICLRREHDD
ncbi:hypothetical protein TSAR_007264 [Trichomalopsis sarcophagae]|uniref:Uncharacterized protein n=1 Tax=Trichomalopsis sarcophagae TaxID=543379 RepID=A0A232EGJ3_9HYME|nr:hypothetical protein TSAR_007264 [Trichomalopsis sarcophagae]